MGSIRYASKQVNKPPTHVHIERFSLHAQSCNRSLTTSWHHFFPSLPFLDLCRSFFFSFHFPSLSFNLWDEDDKQRASIWRPRGRFVHEHRLTILSLVALLGRRGSLRNRLDDCIVRNESDKLWNINVGYRNCVGYIYISGELNLKERLFFTFLRDRVT